MSEAVLSIRGLVRRYVTGADQISVLQGVDLDVMAGEIVGLVGPSGSGKSSLLHAAGLLERPDAGRICILGQDCSDLPDRGRTRVRLGSIGFVYQFHHLLPEFSALDNVALPQMIAGRRKPDAQARAQDLLGQMGLAARAGHQPAQLSGGEQQRVALAGAEEFIERLPAGYDTQIEEGSPNLSGGQKQRLAIARAIVSEPKVILADEPTGNLDPATSAAVFDNLQTLVRQTGVAALIATHNLDLAKHMDRVFTLKDGRLQAQT